MATRHHGAGSLLALLLTFGMVFGMASALMTRAPGAPGLCPDPGPASPAATASPPATIRGNRLDAVAFPAAGGDLTVFAAASLTDAFTAIKADLEAATPNLTITYNFAGSQTLVTQMTEGAAADVFASANLAQMTAAIEAGLIAGDAVTFVANRLVIAVPSDNPAELATAADLATDGLRLVIAQPEVPAGAYARQSICLMGRDSASFGANFVGRVAANVVSEEDDVRDVLTKVLLGEADAGIVYRSDTIVAGDDVRLVDIPDPVNVVATYPIAPVTSGDAALGAAFVAYLLSPEGQATLARYGFAPVP